MERFERKALEELFLDKSDNYVAEAIKDLIGLYTLEALFDIEAMGSIEGVDKKRP